MHFSPKMLAILLCAVSILFLRSANAQSTNASLSGQVTDVQGLVIAAAEVDAVNQATNVVYSTKTNGEGIYSLPDLPPGTYEVHILKDGFRTLLRPGIELHVQDARALNATLQVGDKAEIVRVEGGISTINTENAAVSTVIDRNFAENLPLNGRSFNTLLQLTPGVVIAPLAVNNLTTPGQFSISGERGDANNLTVDGVSANFGVGAGLNQGQAGVGNAQAFSGTGGTSSLVSVDALQEFRIETSSFAPEFGRAPGGQISLLTRSGTNNFHGAVFDYFRNTVMDANDWFANERGNPRAPEHHNDFGGVLGGPILQDRAFFFASYEGARLDLPQTTVISVPSAYARSIAPPAVGPYMNAYPKPDVNTVVPGVYISTFTGTYADRANLDAGSIRIDYKLTDRFTLFGRYNEAPSQTVNRLPFDSLSELQPGSVDTRTVTAGLDMSLTSSFANTLRGNYSSQAGGFSFTMDSFGGATPFDARLALGPLSLAQNTVSYIPLDMNGFNVGLGARNETKQMNFVDGFSGIFGPHQLKFGADYRAIFLHTKPGQYAVAPLVLDTPDFVSPGTAGQLLFLFTSNTKVGRLLAQTLSLYAQDTWKVSRRLTMTYGLRWEWAPAPSGRDSTTLASWINTNDASNIALGPTGASMWVTTYGNFAPRLGLAYSLDNKNSLVVRVGGGIFYDIGVGSSAQLATTFPNSTLNMVPGSLIGGPASVPIGDPTPFLPGPASLTPPYPDPVYAMAHDLRLPRSYQWNLAIEKSFVGRQAVSVTYVGQAGRDLLRQEAFHVPNSNFSGNLFLTANNAYSNYDALQVQYRKPLSGRVQMLLNYTYSHSLDNSSNDYLIAISNLVVSAAKDYASSDFDVRHSFSGAATIALPSAGRSGVLSLLTKDWSVSPVVVARSGTPFNVVVQDAAASALGVAYRRADRVAGQPTYIYGAQCAQVFGPKSQGGNGVLLAGQSCPGGQGLNPSAFHPPSTSGQGNEGRNDIAGFGLAQVDVSVVRKFSISERVHLDLRGDAFNLFNHPNFTHPPGSLVPVRGLLSRQMLNNGLSGPSGGGPGSLFQGGGPRSLQVSLKLSF